MFSLQRGWFPREIIQIIVGKVDRKGRVMREGEGERAGGGGGGERERKIQKGVCLRLVGRQKRPVR